MFLNFASNFIAVDIRRLGVPEHPQNFEVQKRCHKEKWTKPQIWKANYYDREFITHIDKKQEISKIKLIYLWPTWNKLKILITSEMILTQNYTFFASIKHKLKVVLTLFLDTLSSMAEPGTDWWCCFSTGELLLRRAFTQHGQANQPL